MSRCKNCKNIFDKAHFNQQYCFETACTLVWVKKCNLARLSALKREFTNKERLSTTSLTKKLRSVFHLYIRNRDKHKGCISCEKLLYGKYDAGHFWNANNHSNVRFSEDNVHAQCVVCNRHQHGNLLNYQIGLKKRIGSKRYNKLEEERNITKKWTAEELLELIEYYKNKTNKSVQPIE